MEERETAWKKDLAEWLRGARGIESQVALAGRSGISDRTIALIELQRLQRPPRPATIVRLAVATNNDPKAWLNLVGVKLSDKQIETIRRQLQPAFKPTWGDNEAGPVWTREVRRPGEIALRKELFEYVDKKTEETKKIIVDMQGRMEKIASLQARLLDILDKTQGIDLEGLSKWLDNQHGGQKTKELFEMSEGIYELGEPPIEQVEKEIPEEAQPPDSVPLTQPERIANHKSWPEGERPKQKKSTQGS